VRLVPEHARSLTIVTRVLVAEDNPINQKLAKRLLEKLGCQVDVASNGVEAVQMWAQFGYNAIFMDCLMPEMDGYEATRQIRMREQQNPARSHTPIVALTANTMPGDRERCISSGMDDFIPKPIPPDAMNRMLRRWACQTPLEKAS
jgi:two-component system sensor histidine kinase/response regulator